MWGWIFAIALAGLGTGVVAMMREGSDNMADLFESDWFGQ